MLALLAFVTDGMTPSTVLTIPLRPQDFNTGMSVAEMDSSPSPSTRKTIARCFMRQKLRGLCYRRVSAVMLRLVVRQVCEMQILAKCEFREIGNLPRVIRKMRGNSGKRGHT